jgi:hypothetical protein
MPHHRRAYASIFDLSIDVPAHDNFNRTASHGSHVDGIADVKQSVDACATAVRLVYTHFRNKSSISWSVGNSDGDFAATSNYIILQSQPDDVVSLAYTHLVSI